MIEIKEIEKLAQLARIELNDQEKISLQKDLESILNYVSELKEAPTAEKKEEISYLKNVMRDDEEHNLSGEFTDRLLVGAPDRTDNYIKVKKILGSSA